MVGSDGKVFKRESKASDASKAFRDHDDFMAFSLGTELTYCQPQNSAMLKAISKERSVPGSGKKLN